MKIIHVVTLVSSDNAFGGPLRVAVNLSRAMIEQGHDVEIVAAYLGDGQEPPSTIEGVPARLFRARRVLPLGFSGLIAPGLIRYLRTRVKDADMVHVHMTRDLITLPVAGWLSAHRIPFVVQTHGQIDRSTRVLARVLDVAIVRRVLRGARRVFVLTVAEQRDVAEVARSAGIRFAVVPNGATMPPTQASPEASSTVLFLARLAARKRPQTFVRVAAAVHERFPRARFDLVGPDEGEGAAVERLIRELDAGDYVAWRGAASHAEGLDAMQKAAVYVLPAVDEPFALSVLEAMSMGLPCVVTDSCGLVGLVSDPTSLIASSADEEHLQHAVESLLADDELRAETGRRARAEAEANFKIEHIARRVVDQYELTRGEKAGEGALWITNSASPYRRPVWDALGRKLALRVALLESDAMLASDARRGPEWAAAEVRDAGYQLQTLASLRLGRGERRFYVLRQRASALLGRDRRILIGGWESPGYWQMLVVAKLRGARTVGFYESTLSTNRHSRGPIAAARRWFFRHLDAVVVPGAAAEEALLAMGVEARRVYRGFNAVDVQAFSLAAHSQPSHPAIGHRFVYVGQLIGRKNVDGLIRAFSDVRADGDVLTIVGRGEQQAALQSLAQGLSLGDAVVFRGRVPYDELPDLLAQSQTLVLPSREEVWGLVVNEALAAGCHAVVARDAGVAVSVAPMRGVWIVATDRESLAAGMAASRAGWHERILDAEILQKTPDAFADVFFRALTSAPKP